jgi:3-hydroxyisobutyrate dehydrogenase-like beta-hydroxyacid dehydrogenase
MRIGYIGSGTMGSGPGRQLLAENSLTVWDVNATAAFEKLHTLRGQLTATDLGASRACRSVRVGAEIHRMFAYFRLAP